MRSKSADRLTQAVITQVSDDRAERQTLRGFRADLQAILDGWAAASTAQRFNSLQEVIRILRRALRLI